MPDQPEERECVSPILWQLLEQKWMVLGRLYRYGGRFSDGNNVLKLCLGIRGLSFRNIAVVLRQLADIHLELNEPHDAKTLLEPHLAELRRLGAGCRSYYRLLLSYADADILTENFENAQKMLDQVEDHFRRLVPVTPTEQLDHVHSAISLMRIALCTGDWLEGVRRATTALELTSYPSFLKNNYYKGYIHAARAACCSHLVAKDIDLAKQRVLEPRYYIAGLGTFDRTRIRRCLDNGL